MKKTYIQPLTEVVRMSMVGMICGSQDVKSNKGYGIGYGGVDEDGEKDPASRRRRDVWDEGEEEY